MPDDKDTTLDIITCGERVILRGWLPSDCEHFVRWQAQGEWLQFDAPWEEFRPTGTPEDERRNREWFMQQLESDDRCWLSGGAVVATLDNVPLGWVSRYGGQDGPGVIFVGIDIWIVSLLGVAGLLLAWLKVKRSETQHPSGWFALSARRL